ncbi:carbon-nitrogen hydrolase family protein [Streptomyces sp. NPDC001508]|uniref:carbon-nitrogen hydrolase family protein n=1 Tax=Streptomyces sp. NPDC001508 TaxID=3154656 RepID=UPI003324850A
MDDAMQDSRLIRVGMGQMYVEPGDLEGNLQRAETMVGKAAEAGCDVIVLPECCDLGWTHASALTRSAPIPGATSAAFASFARDNGIAVIAGVTERDHDRVFNSAIAMDASGTLLAKHQKIAELSFARQVYQTGSSVQAFDMLGTRIGMTVCADNADADQPVLAGALGLMGARILLSPCAWAVPPDHDNVATPYGEPWESSYPRIARQYNMAVVGVSNVGPVVGGEWDGHRCIGSSLAVDHSGEIIAKLPYGIDAEVLHTIEVAA